MTPNKIIITSNKYYDINKMPDNFDTANSLQAVGIVSFHRMIVRSRRQLREMLKKFKGYFKNIDNSFIRER